MTGRYVIAVEPIRGGRYRAIVTDTTEEETLYPNPASGWSVPANRVWVERRTFDKAANAGAALLAGSIQRNTYEAVLAARAAAECVAVEV